MSGAMSSTVNTTYHPYTYSLT